MFSSVLHRQSYVSVPVWLYAANVISLQHIMSSNDSEVAANRKLIWKYQPCFYFPLFRLRAALFCVLLIGAAAITLARSILLQQNRHILHYFVVEFGLLYCQDFLSVYAPNHSHWLTNSAYPWCKVRKRETEIEIKKDVDDHLNNVYSEAHTQHPDLMSMQIWTAWNGQIGQNAQCIHRMKQTHNSILVWIKFHFKMSCLTVNSVYACENRISTICIILHRETMYNTCIIRPIKIGKAVDIVDLFRILFFVVRCE